MPPTTQQSLLAKKLGNRLQQVHAAVIGQQILPRDILGQLPKIDKGILEISDMGFKEDETDKYKGEIVFFASGVIRSPVYGKDWDDPTVDVKCEGLHSRISIRMCDTDFEGKVTTLQQQYNKLKAYMSDWGLDLDKVKWEDIETTVATFLQFIKKPGNSRYVEFNTFRNKPKPALPGQPQEQKDPFVNSNWGRRVDFTPNINPAMVGVKDTGVKSAVSTPPSNNGSVQATTNGTPPNKVEGGKQYDLDKLFKLASSDAETEEAVAAREKMLELAVANGYTRDEAENAPSWDDTLKMCNNPKTTQTDKHDGATIPEVGHIWVYEHGGKKKDVEILTVENEEVTVKDVETNRVINGGNKKPKKIKFSELSVKEPY